MHIALYTAYVPYTQECIVFVGDDEVETAPKIQHAININDKS